MVQEGRGGPGGVGLGLNKCNLGGQKWSWGCIFGGVGRDGASWN